MNEVEPVDDNGVQNEIKEQEKIEIKDLIDNEEKAFNTLKDTLDDMEKNETNTDEEKKEAYQLVENSIKHIRETFEHIKENIHGKGNALYTNDFKNVHENLFNQIAQCLRARTADIYALKSELREIEKENNSILDVIEKSKRGGGKKTRKSKKAKKAKKARKSRKARKSNRRRR